MRFSRYERRGKGAAAVNMIEIDRGAIEKAVRAYMQEYGQRDSREEKAGYDRRFQLLSLLLEHYRDYPAGSRKKELIDYIMERHRLAYREGITEEFYKVRHNLLVCRFILSKPMGEKEICQRLGIKKAAYDKNIRKGIEELMVYAFGVDGLPPW